MYLKKQLNVVFDFRGDGKGVMVPPLLIDMNGDGTRDILMTAYDGTFTMYNGETLSQLWTVQFPHYETYRY